MAAGASAAGVGRAFGMDGAPGAGPGRPEIGELALQAFDLEPQLSAAGEGERHHAAGRIGLGEFDREQVEHVVLAVGIDAAALADVDALEAQRRAAAPQFRPRSLGGEPIEAAERDDETPLLRLPEYVSNLDQSILQMGRDDVEVVPV